MYPEEMPSALILAGGRGKRLRPLTEHCPKPLLPVNGKPLLKWILEDLYQNGVRHCLLFLGYGSEDIQRTLLTDPELPSDLRLDFIKEERPLGSAGCLWGGEPLLGPRFFVVCADAYGKRDYRGLYEFHRKKGGVGSLFLSRVDIPVEYGLVRTDGEGRILSFLEKPVWSQAFTDLANTGIYLLEKEVLAHIPRDRPADFGKDVFPSLLAAGKGLYGYEDGGCWRDMGAHESYLWCNMHASGNKSVIGQRCALSDARVEGSVLLDGVKVGRGSRIEGSVIGKECVIGQRCLIGRGCVLGDGCHLGDGCILEGGTVLSGGTHLAEGTRLSAALPSDGELFEEEKMVLPQGCREDSAIRLGYALTTAAASGVLFMHDGSKEGCALYEALLRGSILTGIRPTDGGRGFYTLCSALTLYGGYALGVLVCAEKTGGLSLRFFDRSGLSAGGRMIRRIRDGLSAPVVCGRVAKRGYLSARPELVYQRYLLKALGDPSFKGLTVGVDRHTPSGAFLFEVLRAQGANAVDEDKAVLCAELSPDGRRCALRQGREGKKVDSGLPYARADFWHLAAVVLKDRVKRGERIGFLPYRAPDALFDLVKEGSGVRPAGYPLCSAAPIAEEVRQSLYREREVLDGCFLLLSVFSLMLRSGLSLFDLLQDLERTGDFAVLEEGLDCEKNEKIPLMLLAKGSPQTEGVQVAMEKGILRIRARGGRGLDLMAEAAMEQDAREIMAQARQRLLEGKHALHAAKKRE